MKKRIEDLHEQYRGYPANSFQEALSTVADLAEQEIRGLGFVPQSVDELTTGLSTRLATATNILVNECINRSDLFNTTFSQDEAKQTLQFVSRVTNRILCEVSVYYPSSERKRVNHRVDIRYRNPQDNLERIVQLRDTEERAVDINYKDFETRETKRTTRKGERPGEETASLIGEHVSQFGDLAIDRWGGNSAQS